jgi:hypothetical protein
MGAGDPRPVPGGTPPDALAVARQGGWVATRLAQAAGLDDEAIRRMVVARFRECLAGYDEHERETLMAEVQRGIDAALGSGPQSMPDPHPT